MTHADLVERGIAWLRGTQRCAVVLAGRQSRSGETPDVIGWTSSGISHLVECKVSRSDFFADQRKTHRANPLGGLGGVRWYLTPPGLVSAVDVPERFGLAEACPRHVRVVRHALNYKRTELTVAQEMQLLLSELRRYQIHGITYPPLPKRPRRLPPATTDARWLGPLNEGWS